MGVPGLFPILRTTYTDSFSTKRPTISHIYMDGNAMLYPISETTKDPKMIAKLLCDTCVLYAKLYNCHITIVMDGPAHMGKIKQQRARRFTYEPVTVVSNESITNLDKSLTITVDNGLEWSPAMFSPGTIMMEIIHKEILFLMKQSIYSSITGYSSYHESFEGEHKIIEMIKTNLSSSYSFAIIGRDADLILLCMGLIETTNYMVEPYIIRHDDSKQNGYTAEDPIVHINCTTLRNAILASMPPKRSIWDFIIATFMCGNDFMPAIPELSSLQLAIKHINILCPELYIKDMNSCYINWNNLYQFISQLSTIVSVNIKIIPGNDEGILINKDGVSMVSIDTFDNFYYDAVHPFPVDKSRIADVWYTTIGWNMIYYHDGINYASVSWQYPLSFAPSIYTLSKHKLMSNIYDIATMDKDPLTPRQSLAIILPIWLRNLIPNYDGQELDKYNYYYPYKFPLSYKKEAIIPIIPYDVAKNINI